MKYIYEYKDFLNKYPKWYRTGEKGISGSFYDCKKNRYPEHNYNMIFTPDYEKDKYIVFESDQQFCGGVQLFNIFIPDSFYNKYFRDLPDSISHAGVWIFDNCAAIKLKQYGYDYAISKEEYMQDKVLIDYNELINVRDHTITELKNSLIKLLDNYIDTKSMISDLMKIRGVYDKKSIIFDSLKQFKK